MRLFLLSLVFCVSGMCHADNIRMRRACLDESNDEINIRYNYSFTAGVECNTATVSLYGSKDGGAFIRLGVNVFGAKEFTVSAENSRNWKFFIRLVNTCDNDSVGGTDTLDADLVGPIGAKIDSVSVREEGVVIGWTGSSSDDLRNYAMYYDNEGTGLSTTFDTAGRDDTVYIEVKDEINTDEGSVTYTIAAFDSCNLSGGQLDRHSTVHLKLDAVDYCNRTLELSRTRYVGWGDAVVYELVYRVEGALIWRPWVEFTTNQQLQQDMSTLKERFELKVRAMDLVTNVTSSSNTILLDFRENRTLDTFYLYSVNNYGNSIDISWWCSSPELVQKVSLLSVVDGFTTDVRTINTDIKRDNTVKLNSVVPGTKYFLEAYSKCNENLGTSNTGEVIGLELTNGTDLRNKEFNTERNSLRALTWNQYKAWTNGVENYTVSRKLSAAWEELGSIGDSVWNDNEIIEELLDSGMCYTVRAVEKDGVLGFNGVSLSNEVCFTYDFHKDVPNAFVANKEGTSYFKVNVEGLDTMGSLMQIFNRWGQMVYNEGVEWNGGLNNEVTQPCEVGVYYYVLKTQLKSRQFYYSTGQIHLIR